jgi:diadenosine tetraphosphatase ApaH/serine/threonine PP2A family protein phosphatase
MSKPKSEKTLIPRPSPDRRGVSGPFDIIGDVHGCADEMIELLWALGYKVQLSGTGNDRRASVSAPRGRRAVFVGDLVDRGPASPDVLRVVMALAASDRALCVPGNHDVKFVRWIDGRNVVLAHGLELTAAQFKDETAEFRAEVRAFLTGLPVHLWLDGGALAVAHAGIKPEMLGRDMAEIRGFCYYGETSGETDEFGLPVRYHWAAEYTGETAIIYGHTPVPRAEWFNNTLCIDTGCCFGGNLTALRWPEREIVSVPSRETYAAKRRPFGHPPVRPATST